MTLDVVAFSNWECPSRFSLEGGPLNISVWHHIRFLKRHVKWNWPSFSKDGYRCDKWSKRSFFIVTHDWIFFGMRLQILNSSFFAFIFPVSVIYEHPTLAVTTKTAISSILLHYQNSKSVWVSEIPHVQSDSRPDSQLNTHTIAEEEASFQFNGSVYIEHKVIFCKRTLFRRFLLRRLAGAITAQ